MVQPLRAHILLFLKSTIPALVGSEQNSTFMPLSTPYDGRLVHSLSLQRFGILAILFVGDEMGGREQGANFHYTYAVNWMTT